MENPEVILTLVSQNDLSLNLETLMALVSIAYEGRGGALVEAMPFDRRVVGSTSAQAVT